MSDTFTPGEYFQASGTLRDRRAPEPFQSKDETSIAQVVKEYTQLFKPR